MDRLEGHDFVVLFLSLALLLGMARIFGEISQRLRQPPLIGEILSGILLGPTFLGVLAPGMAAFLLPVQGGVAYFFDGLIALAVSLFLLVAGLSVDLTSIWRQGKTAVTVSLAGICFPFLLGLSVAWTFLDYRGDDSGVTPLAFSLFFSASLSISALPVIAKIFLDMGLYRSDFGMLVIGAAVFNDLVGWIIFAIVLGMAGAYGPGGSQPLFIVSMTLAFIAFLLVVGRWGLNRLLPWIQARSNVPGAVGSFAIMLALLCGGITEWIGIHASFGAFLAGVALGDSAHLREHTRTVIDRFVSFFFAPLFFASIGLRVDFVTNFDGPLVILILIIATAGKVLGCGLAGRLAGMIPRQAWAVGFALNARGGMQIILGLLALQGGLINEALFVALVFMALVTTITGGPAIRFLLRQKSPHRLTSYISSKTFFPILAAEDREEAIREIALRVSKVVRIPFEDITSAVLDRERAAATGLGYGVAVPHGRIRNLNKPVVAVGLSRFGIDFDAPDGKKAQLIFLLLIPEEEKGILLDLHADIAHTFSREEIRRPILEAADYNEFVGLIKDGRM